MKVNTGVSRGPGYLNQVSLEVCSPEFSPFCTPKAPGTSSKACSVMLLLGLQPIPGPCILSLHQQELTSTQPQPLVILPAPPPSTHAPTHRNLALQVAPFSPRTRSRCTMVSASLVSDLEITHPPWPPYPHYLPLLYITGSHWIVCDPPILTPSRGQSSLSRTLPGLPQQFQSSPFSDPSVKFLTYLDLTPTLHSTGPGCYLCPTQSFLLMGCGFLRA